MSLLTLPSQQTQTPLAALESLLRIMHFERKAIGYAKKSVTPYSIAAMLNITDNNTIHQIDQRAKNYVEVSRRAEVKAQTGAGANYRNPRAFYAKEFVVHLGRGDVKRVMV